MKIVIAPQAFKGTYSAEEIAQAIAAGAKNVFPNAILSLVPIADGGDDTLNVLIKSKKGEFKSCQAHGTFGYVFNVPWGTIGDLAIIELASICGLSMSSPEKRNVLIASSYGVGEVIRNALDLGYRRFFIGMGGSATNDGGVGIAAALGIKFFDMQGKELSPGGAALLSIHHIEMSQCDPRLAESEIIIGCDVENPLIGPQGASRVYAPQKGASTGDVELLERALTHFADVVQNELNLDIRKIAKGGAAGGAAAGMLAFFGAQLTSGINFVLEQIDFTSKLENADLVITGEGCLDQQTFCHKGPQGVAECAKKVHLPVLAIVGSVKDELSQSDHYFDEVYVASEDGQTASLEQISRTTERALKEKVFNSP